MIFRFILCLVERIRHCPECQHTGAELSRWEKIAKSHKPHGFCPVCWESTSEKCSVSYTCADWHTVGLWTRILAQICTRVHVHAGDIHKSAWEWKHTPTYPRQEDRFCSEWLCSSYRIRADWCSSRLLSVFWSHDPRPACQSAAVEQVIRLLFRLIGGS